VIATVILSSGFSHSIFAFSNKYSNQQRYDSGVRDGNIACNQGLDANAISEYQQSSRYLGHFKYYQHGYDDTVNNCSTSDNGSGGGNQPSQSPNPDTPQQTPDNSNPPNNLQQSPQNDNNAPNGSNGQILDIGSICNTLQIAFYHSCSELVNPDGRVTPLGSDTVKCTLTDAIGGLGGIAIFHLPPGMIIDGLNFLDGKTGCSGLVKIDQLSSIGNIGGILNLLTKFIP
jgi:hypothetical protein